LIPERERENQLYTPRKVFGSLAFCFLAIRCLAFINFFSLSLAKHTITPMVAVNLKFEENLTCY
jgi:hypothetical protein